MNQPAPILFPTLPPTINIPRKNRDGWGGLQFTPFSGPEFTMSPARYAKGMVAVTCPGKDGYKTRAGYLCSSICRERYSGREQAYILSPAQAERFYRLYLEGWDANIFGNLIAPNEGAKS